MEKIFAKIENGEALTYDDAVKMLNINVGSPNYRRLTALADAYSRNTFNNKGIVFAQIGIDAQPCPVDCKFCSFACGSMNQATKSIKTDTEIVELAKQLVSLGAHELFLMTTAAFDKTEYLRIAKIVRNVLPKNMPMVANVGDFDYQYAKQLVDVGFTGVYHICRLGEGNDTAVSTNSRMETITALHKAGLALYYCVEPIGPEHTNQQIADEIFRTAEFNVGVMAVMRRVAVPGTPMYNKGMIPAHRLALICAVTLLCTKPKRAMGVHEPEQLSLMCGANQIYAECGVNPRDEKLITEENRGFSVEDAYNLLNETGWSK